MHLLYVSYCFVLSHDLAPQTTYNRESCTRDDLSCTMLAGATCEGVQHSGDPYPGRSIMHCVLPARLDCCNVLLQCIQGCTAGTAAVTTRHYGHACWVHARGEEGTHRWSPMRMHEDITLLCDCCEVHNSPTRT